jgi:UDP-N-acetyl-2-amino-2-deoxyglucuronate dehydrogenase
MGEKVRMGFVGIGNWSMMLANAAQHSKRIEIAACYSRTISNMNAFTEKYGGIAAKTLDELLNDDNIQALILTVPHSQHSIQVIKALKNNKHVFVEKPMALTVEECKRMNEVAIKSGRLLAVGHNNRRMKIYRKAMELIKKGKLGNLILAEACTTSDLGDRLTPKNWRWYRKESPAGPFTAHTIHQVDNLNYLVGPIKSVMAFAGKKYGKSEMDDAIAAVLEFENGAIGYLGGAVVTPGRNLCQLYGTEGILSIDKIEGALQYLPKGEKTMKTIPIEESTEEQLLNSLAEEMDEFASAIQEDGNIETTGEIGMAGVAVMEACMKSFAARRPINIKDLL